MYIYIYTCIYIYLPGVYAHVHVAGVSLGASSSNQCWRMEKKCKKDDDNDDDDDDDDDGNDSNGTAL